MDRATRTQSRVTLGGLSPLHGRGPIEDAAALRSRAVGLHIPVRACVVDVDGVIDINEGDRQDALCWRGPFPPSRLPGFNMSKLALVHHGGRLRLFLPGRGRLLLL